MPFAPIDYVFFAIIIIAAIRCAIRGFVSEILSMAALILGIGCAVLFSAPAGRVVESYIGESVWTQIIAFLIIFISVYLVVKLLEGLLARLVDKINLDKLDRSLGLFLGLLEGCIVVVAIVFILQVQPFFNTQKILEGGIIPEFVLKIFSFEAGNLQVKLQDAFNYSLPGLYPPVC